MTRKELKILEDNELIKQFAWVASRCVPQQFQGLEQKKNDKENIERIETYRNFVNDYITCIKELKSRGYTLQEIMEVRV